MQPGTDEWLAQVSEPIIEPEQPVVDPHHHLWPAGGALPYGVDELVADTMSGHNVVGTVFVECGAGYRDGGPEHLRPVGETEFVAASAADLTARHPGAAPIAAIVGHADLTRPDLDDVLDAHVEAGDGRFRGVRDALAHAVDAEAMAIPRFNGEHKAAAPAFRAGVARLGERGLTYDTWQYHYQLPALTELACAVPDTTIVLDHFSTPLGVGRFADRGDEIFEQWYRDIADLAACPNVVAKLGGLAMPDNGFGWHTAPKPATSDDLVEAQQRYYDRAIEVFGPDRCMLESNFPVDRVSVSYPVLWNALKKLVAGYSPDERSAMLAGTASRVYGLDLDS